MPGVLAPVVIVICPTPEVASGDLLAGGGPNRALLSVSTMAAPGTVVKPGGAKLVFSDAAATAATCAGNPSPTRLLDPPVFTTTSGVATTAASIDRDSSSSKRK